MKSFIRYGLATWMVIFSLSFSFGQNWSLRSTSDFNYYYKAENRIYIDALDSLFREDLYELQKKLNYFVNQPIDIFIVEKEAEARVLQQSMELEDETSGGVISLLPKKITVRIGSSYSQLSYRFREVATAILLEEMMYGINLQDRVRNANLIHLPEWVMPGLVHYLTDNWSVETDNQWRMVYDEYGLDNFNTIPDRYATVKGASFWKFIAFKYGDNAIPTMLYMARLTRKFSSASYYSFQVSIGDIYQEWKKYYQHAYSFDQKKPNPVQGFNLDIAQVYELHVVSQNSFYSLEQSGFGYTLYYNTIQPRAKKKLLRLKKGEYPVSKFSGALVGSQNETHLLVNNKKGIVKYTIRKKSITKSQLPLNYITQCKAYNNELFVTLSNEKGSNLYKIDRDSLKLVYQSKGYIKSFDLRGTSLVVLSEKQKRSKLEIVNLDSHLPQHVIVLKDQSCKQPLFANDSTILFNSNKNGIWNGKMWKINQDFIEEVTNYRSNIAYHDYSEDVFVEYLDRGEMSSLFITEHLNTNDFYRYDTIIPAFFYEAKMKSSTSVSRDSITKNDSLELYTFQSPINPDFDFTLSNYDSLVKESVKKRNSNNLEVKALDVFKPAKLVVQVSNKLLMDETIGYKDAIRYHTPNNLNLRISSKYINQYNTKSIELAYQGLLQAYTHDVAFSFSNKEHFNYKLEMLHRQRILFNEQKRNRYSVDLLRLSHKRPVNNVVSYALSSTTRFDRNIALATDEEAIDQPSERKIVSLLNFDLSAEMKKRKVQWKADLNVAPHYSFLNSGWNVTNGLKFSIDYKLNNWMKLSSTSQARTSLGSNPIAFVLGGQNQDVLSNYFNRNFSEVKEPMLFDLIYSVRGFGANYRNGSTIVVTNFDWYISPMHGIIAKPLVSEFFSNLQVIPFFDVATSFYGKGIYDKANSLNKVQINSSTGTIQAEVNSFKNPLIGSLGLGVSTQVYSYRIRFDLAYGVEESEFKTPVFHLRLGYAL